MPRPAPPAFLSNFIGQGFHWGLVMVWREMLLALDLGLGIGLNTYISVGAVQAINCTLMLSPDSDSQDSSRDSMTSHTSLVLFPHTGVLFLMPCFFSSTS